MDNLAYRGASGNDDAFTTEEVYDSELKKLEEERYSETYDEIADLPSRNTNALMPNNIVYRSAVSDISGVISELHTLRSAMFRKEALKNGFIAVPNNGLCKECSNAPRRDVSKGITPRICVLTKTFDLLVLIGFFT
ncbi:unnamed protein product [Toxocara canis]|uniref:Reverse transcriptase domain-containing protein n=1 Tax=Toxocara canis TaxID=6265 RepID=A0A183VBR6_TOXCA|nr:unnamed protein product [Toxocara canis]